jgi:hypothetical protein
MKIRSFGYFSISGNHYLQEPDVGSPNLVLMPFDRYLNEMEDQITLSRNWKFIVCVVLIGIYHACFLGFLISLLM